MSKKQSGSAIEAAVNDTQVTDEQRTAEVPAADDTAVTDTTVEEPVADDTTAEEPAKVSEDGLTWMAYPADMLKFINMRKTQFERQARQLMPQLDAVNAQLDIARKKLAEGAAELDLLELQSLRAQNAHVKAQVDSLMIQMQTVELAAQELSTRQQICSQEQRSLGYAEGCRHSLIVAAGIDLLKCTEFKLNDTNFGFKVAE